MIISGAGPAGSIAAYSLSKAGISVLILEKAQFPRYKVCGAGLTHKILSILPFDISPLIHTTIYSFRFSSGFADVFTRKFDSPLIYCTMRDEMDAFFLDKAIEAGAKVIFGSKVTSMVQDPDGVNVVTSNGSFRTKYLIGADGASSKVARTFSLNRDIEWGMAWEAEVKTPKETLERYRETVFLDWGTFPGGYAWVFPKKDHLSIGIGGPAHMAKKMPAYYKDFISSSGIPVLETISNRSHPLPVRTKKSVFHSGRVLVAGDAAGLTDALTGEGIYWAVKSAGMAAEAIAGSLRKDCPGLSAYTDRINLEIMPEMLEARNICGLFNAMPKRIHYWVRDNDRVWKAFGKVLRGERAFIDVPSAFGRWRPFWKSVCLAGSAIQKIKEKRYMND